MKITQLVIDTDTEVLEDRDGDTKQGIHSIHEG